METAMMAMLEPGLAPQIERWTSLLLEQGWCVIPNAASPQLIEAIDTDLAGDFRDTPFCNGGFYGARTKRFGRLLARSPLARKLVQHPLIFGISASCSSRGATRSSSTSPRASRFTPAHRLSSRTATRTCGAARSARPNIWST
jgi:hypothetical protein